MTTLLPDEEVQHLEARVTTPSTLASKTRARLTDEHVHDRRLSGVGPKRITRACNGGRIVHGSGLSVCACEVRNSLLPGNNWATGACTGFENSTRCMRGLYILEDRPTNRRRDSRLATA